MCQLEAEVKLQVEVLGPNPEWVKVWLVLAQKEERTESEENLYGMLTGGMTYLASKIAVYSKNC